MKKVFIDARSKGHSFALFSKHIAQGLFELQNRKGLEYEPVFLIHSEEKTITNLFKTMICQEEFLSPKGWFELPKILLKEKASVYHSTTFDSLPYCPCPWISTIHDLNHLRYGNWIQKLYYQSVLKPFAKKAAILSTVSEFSREEIAHWLHRDLDSVSILNNAIEVPVQHSEEEETKLLQKYGLKTGNYFLSISNTKPHKNLALLVSAFTKLQEYPEYQDQPWKMVLSVPPVYESENLSCIGDLDSKSISILLKNAGAFLFPSLYEGFGRPPVEAAVHGTPLIISNIPPHKEGLSQIRADEVTWVDPQDEKAWIVAMRKSLRAELKRPSLQVRERLLDTYSSISLGKQVDELYKRVL